MNKLINQVKTLGELVVAPYKLEVGGQRHTPGWITTDKSQLDVTNLNDWKERFKPGEIKIIFAEHLLEHLCPDEAKHFLKIAYEYLCDGGRIRLAVPDAMHPSAWYHELCKPGGVDIGSDDHKYFFSYDNINEFFDHDKYDLRLLEWWDEHEFHKAQWQNDGANGKVERSSQFYDGRIAQSKQLQKLLYNTTPEKMRPYYSQYGITYTSLIFDLIKKKPECVKIADHPENSGQLINSKTLSTPTIKTIDGRILDLPHLPSEQLVKYDPLTSKSTLFFDKAPAKSETCSKNPTHQEQERNFYDICAENMQMLPEERRLLQKVLQNKNSYLEIGSGYSTIWCSRFVPRVVSVEPRKPWFDEIKLYLGKFGISNVELYFFPPESCAYYEDGREAWCNRNTPEGNDYGRAEEFIAYLRGIERLLDSNHFDVVLVDGHVRKQVIEMLIRKKYDGIVLLHDVTPERDYMNRPILALDGVKIVNQAESIVELSLFNQRHKESHVSHLTDEQPIKYDPLTNKSALFFDKAPAKGETCSKNPTHQLNKVIGFCLSRRDVALDFAFGRHFPWLRFEKLHIGPWFVHLWGHGDFTSFIIQQNDQTKIVAGYTQQELELLGTERLENRGVFIRIHRDTIEIENDIIGSFRVFYGSGQDNVCVSSIEGLVLQSIGRQPIDKINLIQYLLLGHLTGEHTIWPHIFTMKANSLLRCNGRVFETCPLAPLHFRTSKNPVDDLYTATVSTIRKYTEGYGRLFLPLSGGYDSRMLAACVQQPERVTARTYDYSYPIETAYEVSRARLVAKAAGIKDWDCCDLGADFYADYGRRWFDIFGTSHHLHGMYILVFYDKIFGDPELPVPILSGYIGDVFVGHQLDAFEQVRDTNLTTKFWRSQFVSEEGFKIEEIKSLLNYDVDSLLPVVFKRWEQLWQECEGEEYQKFILNFVQHRGRNHISYLCTLADIYGAAITPFTDREYIETVLGLPYKFLFSRLAQEQVFQKYFPSFWLDESKLPGYKHCINFLCMRKRKIDNIFPIIIDNFVQSHSLFRTETVKQWVREFTDRCNSGELIYGHKDIRSLYRLNTLRPLFYFDYLNGPESERAQNIQKDGDIIDDKQFELSCATVRQDDFSAQEFFQKGIKLLQSGSSEEALNYFNQARNLCFSMPDVHFAIATAYAQLGDVYSTKKMCQIELSLHPENAGAKRLLGRIERMVNEGEPAGSKQSISEKLGDNFSEDVAIQAIECPVLQKNSNGNNIKISIILTVYKKEIQIARIIKGIINNTTSPFQLVIVYDGYTDRPEQVVNQMLLQNKGLMQELKVVRTPDICELMANNAGMKTADGEYWILMQDDMLITEKGWEKRIIRPIEVWDDVFSVSARNAHSFICSAAPEKKVISTCTESAQRAVFKIRDAVNRGPLALRASTMKELNYFDEAYFPCYFDDMDLCTRAYKELGKVSGVYHIDWQNLTGTGGADTNHIFTATGDVYKDVIRRNKFLFWHRYHDYYKGQNHDEDRILVFEPAQSSIAPAAKSIEAIDLYRIGSDYGGWAVDLDLVSDGSVVISAGVGEDISFDMGLIDLKKCSIIGIDPTEKARKYIEGNKHPNISFIQKALCAQSGSQIKMYKNTNPEFVSDSILPSHGNVSDAGSYTVGTINVPDILSRCPDISILKMDIEGAEYEVISSLDRLDIPQVCIEFHHFCSDFTEDDTKKCIEHMKRLGYVAAYDTNPRKPFTEFTFIHKRCVSSRNPVEVNIGT